MEGNVEGRLLMSPDFQIVGATKCCTSTLHYWLSKHPMISMSSPKETPVIDQRFQNWGDEYLKYFPDYSSNGNKIFGDANPNLFIIPWAPDRIKIANPNTKIIICIREPVERCYSHWKYFHLMRPGREPESFSKTIVDNLKDFNLNKFKSEADYMPYVCEKWGNYRKMYVETGCYANYIKKYLDDFEVKVVLKDDLEENPELALNSIQKFLNVPVFDLHNNRIRNVGCAVDKEKGDLETLQYLKTFYRSWNESLSDMIGINLIKRWVL